MIADLLLSTDSNWILAASITGGRPTRTRQKILERMGDVGNGIKCFKKGMRDDEAHGKRAKRKRVCTNRRAPSASRAGSATRAPIGQSHVKTSRHWRYGFRRGVVVFAIPETRR